jgi:hypothetical protein
MKRITQARVSFHGLRGGPGRASAIAQRALREIARMTAAGQPAPRVQLTVRVPDGASDAAIADRIGAAVRRRLRGPI